MFGKKTKKLLGLLYVGSELTALNKKKQEEDWLALTVLSMVDGSHGGSYSYTVPIYGQNNGASGNKKL